MEEEGGLWQPGLWRFGRRRVPLESWRQPGKCSNFVQKCSKLGIEPSIECFGAANRRASASYVHFRVLLYLFVGKICVKRDVQIWKRGDASGSRGCGDWEEEYCLWRLVARAKKRENSKNIQVTQRYGA